jgi:hypothetical protein
VPSSKPERPSRVGGASDLGSCQRIACLVAKARTNSERFTCKFTSFSRRLIKAFAGHESVFEKRQKLIRESGGSEVYNGPEFGGKARRERPK